MTNLAKKPIMLNMDAVSSVELVIPGVACAVSNSGIFDVAVSYKLQKALLRSIFQNYKDSSAFCWKHFAAPQAKDLSGGFRRAKIEEEWSGISTLFPEVKVTVRKYKNKTGSFNELKCGVVKLTQSCVLDPAVVPRFAVFRRSLAKTGQYLLFPESNTGDSPSVGTASYLYSLLIHGVNTKSKKRSLPSFAKIMFPNDTCTDYVDDGIDLFKRFPEVVAEYTGTAEFYANARPRQTKRRVA